MENKKLLIIDELNTLLKALDRFFTAGTIYTFEEDITFKNFYKELDVIKDVILRILSALDILIPDSSKNAYWLRKYAEIKFFSLYPNISLIDDLKKQDTPEKSLLLLYDSFINLKGIIIDILKSEFITFTSFKNIGDSIKKEIRENKHFNPFLKDINIEIDKIDNQNIIEIVKNIKDKTLKKYLALFYIYTFRLLRYTNYIDINSHYSIALNTSIVLLFLIKTEISLLLDFIKKFGKIVKEKNFSDILNLISYQIKMETKRVYSQELKNIFDNIPPELSRGKLENSKGILVNLLEQIVIQITQYFRADINGKYIFNSFTTKFYQSKKLREDIYVFLKILEKLELDFSKTQKKEAYLKSLNEFIHYFKSSTLKFIRFNDYENFIDFINEFTNFKPYNYNKLLERIKHFKIFLETYINQIEKREELKDVPIDIKKAEETLKKFL